MNKFRISIVSALAAMVPSVALADEQASATEQTLGEGDEPAVVFMPKENPEGPEKVHINFQARADFSWENPVGEESTLGFHGRYFNLYVYGEPVKGLSYSLRQRLNKFNEARSDAFAATDWLFIQYMPTKNWAFSGGKEIIAMGSYEYDSNPIDLFFTSLFWNNFACFQFGTTASYITNNGNHKFSAQVTNSPFANPGDKCFAYNFMWTGKFGLWRPMWSVNAIEYERNKFANYIGLGNHFDFGQVFVELDLINTYAPHQRFFLDDFSLIGKVQYDVVPGRFNIFAKGGYEQFKVVPGDAERIDKPFYGLGVQFYPIKNYPQLRLHAAWDIDHDNDGRRYQQAQVGVSWRVDLLSVK